MHVETYIVHVCASVPLCVFAVLYASISASVCADDVSVFFDRQYSDNQVVSSLRQGRSNSSRITTFGTYNKNSSGDEIANVNFFLQYRTCRGQRLRPLNEFVSSTKHLRYLPTHQSDFLNGLVRPVSYTHLTLPTIYSV